MEKTIQKLIHYNELLLKHYKEKNLSKDEIIEALVIPSKLLQTLIKECDKLNEKLTKFEYDNNSLKQVRKEMLSLIFDKKQYDFDNMELMYKLANRAKELNIDNRDLKLRNSQLAAEIEILKQQQINNF